MGKPKLQLAGRRFGRWSVIEEAPRRSGSSHTFWRCICDCGVERKVIGHTLASGRSMSCGCLIRQRTFERTFKHGASRGRVPEYGVWKNMIARCTRPGATNYSYYGGRGITVCDRWRHDFSVFYRDMGPRPSKKHQIERLDNSKGYCAGNCAWVLPVVNSRNRRCRADSSTGVRGVTKEPNGKFRAGICHIGESIHLGVFDTIEQAAEARRLAELHYWHAASSDTQASQSVTR